MYTAAKIRRGFIQGKTSNFMSGVVSSYDTSVEDGTVYTYEDGSVLRTATVGGRLLLKAYTPSQARRSNSYYEPLAEDRAGGL